MAARPAHFLGLLLCMCILAMVSCLSDRETKFLKYMLQRRANGELSLYGYERKLFQDLIAFVGESRTPPDPLDPTSVNLYDQSDFVAVTWITYNVYMSKKTTLRLSVCAKFDMYVCMRTDKL